MSRSIALANLGAEEEGAGTPAPAAEAARLWALLHAAATPCLDGQGRALPVSWPEALGAPAEAPAFRWMGAEEGVTAWLDTPEAEAFARERGLPLLGAPADVVRRVHDKAFAHRACEEAGLVPRSLRGLVEVFEPEELADADAALDRLRAALAGWPAWTRGRFTLKPRLGGSGRGRVPGSRDALDETALRAALPRLARQGGALLEPWLERRGDRSVQLHVAADGTLTLLGTLELRVTASGLFAGHRGVLDHRLRVASGTRDQDDLLEAATTLGRAAHAAGYRGPCGVDAFHFRSERGEELRPAAELNARFTMGTVAVGLLRRARRPIKRRFGKVPGRTLHFGFALRGPARGPEGAEALRLPLGAEPEAEGPLLVVAEDPAAVAELLGG